MPEFQDLQRRFSAHLRDPIGVAAPQGIEDRRLGIYRDLFYNNIEGALANAFPVLRRLCSDEHWQALVRDFYARHLSLDPVFQGLAAEFLRYLETERGPGEGDLPFMQELAHYEWVELALSIAPDDVTAEQADAAGDLLLGAPLVSSLAWTLAYAYPVHRIGPGCLPSAPSDTPTYLVVHRNRQEEVKFIEINAVTARLLQLIESAPAASGREHLEQIAAELGAAADEIVPAGLQMLQGLRDRGVVLGTRRP